MAIAMYVAIYILGWPARPVLAEQSRAEQSRAEQSRAEQSKRLEAGAEARPARPGTVRYGMAAVATGCIAHAYML